MMEILVLGHRRTEVGDTPNFSSDGAVSAGHDGQWQNENEDQHVKLVDLPADWTVPVADTPESRFANSHR